ncbi:hypothetical protein GCM10022244_30220 [Streptomyces gulbargensis]|uniref:Uncharacterized protein n=1 Tax=Streptomyces gulbargensis TaxID=364901 RepID=A0ABP7MAL7_9ACTN
MADVRAGVHPRRNAGSLPPQAYARYRRASHVLRPDPPPLRVITATTVRGRAYDVVVHQQAETPEQLLTSEPAEAQARRPGAGGWSREAIDMTALRALRKSRTHGEALDLTADRLCRLQDALAEADDDSRVRADRCTGQDDDTRAVGPVRTDDQQAHARGSPDHTAAGRPATGWTRCRGAYRRRPAPSPPGEVHRPGGDDTVGEGVGTVTLGDRERAYVRVARLLPQASGLAARRRLLIAGGVR